MIHVYERLTDRVVSLKGEGTEIFEDFAALCGTLANEIIEQTGASEQDAVAILAKTMAQGVSERNHTRKEG